MINDLSKYLKEQHELQRRLNKIVEVSGISAKDFSDKFSLPYSYFRDLLEGRRSIQHQMVDEIEKDILEGLKSKEEFEVAKETIDIIKAENKFTETEEQKKLLEKLDYLNDMQFELESKASDFKKTIADPLLGFKREKEGSLTEKYNIRSAWLNLNEASSFLKNVFIDTYKEYKNKYGVPEKYSYIERNLEALEYDEEIIDEEELELVPKM